jgi:hypothetical protein
MTADMTAEREAFEASYRERYDSRLYCEAEWRGWQAARAASPQPQDGWISVEDRLPDDPKQQCLVYWGMSLDVPRYGIATLSDKWMHKLLWRGHGGAHVDVTHWKPIALPQQQEDSNADR